MTTKTYAEKQWEDRCRVAVMLAAPIVRENRKTGEQEMLYRSWNFIKQVTKLSWDDLRMVFAAIGKAKENTNGANTPSPEPQAV